MKRGSPIFNLAPSKSLLDQIGYSHWEFDKYHLLILHDLAYLTKDQAETSVLFELISARYERRSMLISANHHSVNGAKFSRIKP
jgi:DNA replication protein DnaC